MGEGPSIRGRDLGWRDWPLLLLLGAVAFILNVVLLPIEALKRHPTARYKELSAMRLDALTQSIVEKGDLKSGRGESKPSDYEMQKIVEHVSRKCAIGALSDVPQVRQLFEYSMFWLHNNALIEHERLAGVAVGFWIGVIVTGLVAWLLC